MSRSRKKNAVCKQKNDKFMKNYANRVIRRGVVRETVPSGMAYKKYFEPWDICDWRWFVASDYNSFYRTTKRDRHNLAVQYHDIKAFQRGLTDEEIYRDWITQYKAK